ncbi:MAG: hypothetical protein JNL18_18720 [Planctomycetaceae bacterium]|nr:hypothetical protein [Planctomycetaceae bacterium]
MAGSASPSKSVVRIGLFGPKNCGKSCAVGAMVSLRENEAEGISLSITDAETLRIVSKLVKPLKKGQLPEATPIGAFNNLRFTAVIGDEKIEVETIDYAGECTTPVPDNAGIHADLMTWMAQCDVIMVFVNGTDSNLDHFDAYDALMKVIDESRYSRSLILVVTKTDAIMCRTEVEAENSGHSTRESENALAKLYKDHRVLNRVDKQLLKRDNENTRFESAVLSRRSHKLERVLTSSLGWRFRDQQEVEPCGVFLAMKKAVLSGSACRAERRNRQRAIAVVVLAATLLLAWAGLRMHFNSVLASHLSSVDMGIGSDAVSHRIVRYHIEIEPYSSYLWLLGLEEKVSAARRLYDDDINAEVKQERQQFEALEAQKRYAQAAAARFVASDAELFARDDPQRTSLARDFLERWRTVLDANSIKVIENIASDPPIAKELTNWNQLKALPIDIHRPYDAKAAILVKYAESVPQFGHLEEARRLADDLTAQHREDAKEFSDFIAIASSPSNWSAQQKIQKGFERYCNSARHSHVMAPTLGNYLRQLTDFLSKKRPVEIAITDLSMKAALTSAGVTQGTPQIAIRLGGHTDTYTAPPQRISSLAPYGTNRAAKTRIPFKGYSASLADETPLHVEFRIEMADQTLQPFSVRREFAPWYQHVNKSLELGDATISLVCELPKPPLPPTFLSDTADTIPIGQ